MFSTTLTDHTRHINAMSDECIDDDPGYCITSTTSQRRPPGGLSLSGPLGRVLRRTFPQKGQGERQ